MASSDEPPRSSGDAAKEVTRDNTVPPTRAQGSPRARRAVGAAQTRGTVAAERGRLWIENQDPASRRGATIGWVRRYQAADGQLYAVLLSAYIFLTVLPTMLVETSYVYANPAALADHAERRLGLVGATATLFRSVLVGAGEHRFVSVLLAVLNIALFGLGFGRVLQLVHSRSWGIDLRKNAAVDQARYASVLVAMVALCFLFVLQTKQLAGDPAWIGWLLDLAWLVVLVAFFTLAPRELLHRRVAVRDLLPGAVFTVLGLIGLRIISTLLLVHYLDTYSKTYGALGIVMALFFWIILAATVLVLAAALSPALAHRRDLTRERLATHGHPDAS
jgi:membrane protein